MSFPEFFFSASPKDAQSTSVGASISTEQDHFDYYHHFQKWIEETKTKLPKATPSLRKEAFLADPMISGTVYPYLKNVLLHDFKIITNDNKLYSAAVQEIKDYLESIKLIQCFRDDFLNYAFLVGHSYLRLDPGMDLNVARLVKLDPASIEVYEDPWDDNIIAYHQKARVKTSWSKMSTTIDVDSWFLPFSTYIEDIYSTWALDRGTGNNLKVYDLFQMYKTKYGITDETNLRIGSSERILAMHNSDIKGSPDSYEERHWNVSAPAPIDPVILAIWLKRLLLVNSPNLIYVVLSPFLHLVSGVLKDAKDAMGNPVIITSNPRRPSTALQTANSTLYNAELANFNAWVDSLKDAGKNVIESLKNGGVYASGPDLEIKPIESSRTVSFQLIQGLIQNLNEEICLGFGLPIALISAKGTELASSRNIVQTFNNIQAGKRADYETVADELIKKRFAGKKWIGQKTEKDEETRESKEVSVEYTFEELYARFELVTPDVKDLLQEAQIVKTKAEALTQLKAVGAGKEDLQALGEEYGFGLLALDGQPVQDAPMSPEEGGTTGGGAAQITAILKSCLAEVLQEQGYFSAGPTDPSGFEEKEIVEKLQEAYKTAKESIDVLFEGQ